MTGLFADGMAEMEAQQRIEAERCTLALQSKRSRRMLDMSGPLFDEPTLFGTEMPEPVDLDLAGGKIYVSHEHGWMETAG